jgi:hypothetical protein
VKQKVLGSQYNFYVNIKENFELFFFCPTCSCSYCLESSLNSTKARGKVLVCQHAESSMESKLEKSVVVKEAGAVGMILVDVADKDVAIPFVIPAATVGRGTADQILSYVNRTRFVLLLQKTISECFNFSVC